MVAPTERENSLTTRNGGPTWPEDRFLSPFVHMRRNGPPRDDQGLSTSKPRSSHVTWGRVETRPPPLVPPFLLAQSLSPKDIAGSDVMS